MLRNAALKSARHALAPVASPRFFEESSAAPGTAPRDEIVAGLQQAKAKLSPKFFYDVLGSHLFEAITELEEYYPTRTEASIFETMAARSPPASAQGRR